MRSIFALLIAILSFLSPASADPGDLWEGTWRNNDSKTIWLFQDGDRVWGSTSHNYRYVASLSPDGRTIRGTYYEKSHKQGLFEFTLRADGETYDSQYIKGGDPYPSSAAATGYGYRAETTYTRTDYIDLAVSDGTQGFDDSYNPADPADVAWMNFQPPYEQPVSQTIDISDLEVPAAGNAGLWIVRDNLGQQVGTVGMDRDLNGSFVATGQVRFPDFQGGTPLLATFTEDATNRSLDTVRLEIVLSGDQQTATVNIRAAGTDSYTVVYDGAFLGIDRYAMRLELIAGSIPPPAAADLSNLTSPAPGRFGLMNVSLNSEDIGTVSWNQDANGLVALDGQVVLPILTGASPWDLSVATGAGLLDDRFRLTELASGTVIYEFAIIKEREGDYYQMFVPAGTLTSTQTDEWVFHFVHIPGSTQQGNAGNDPLLTNTYFVTALDESAVAKIHDAANRSAPVIAYLDSTQTGITMLGCDPEPPAEARALTGAELTDKLQGRYCQISFDSPTGGVTGWVLGNYLTR